MADTRQILLWSLERACPFRRGQDWQKPAPTNQAVRVLNSFSTTKPTSVSGDLAVTGWSYSKEGTRPLGYRIGEVFAKFGGLATAKETCAACEANAWDDQTDKMGGCFGTVGVDPDSDELQSALVESIQSKSLQGAIGESFVSTNPLWYGLWVNSPLSHQQCALLAKILSDIHLLDLNDRRFLLALQAAVEHRLPLHVDLTPLGHTDFGFYTVFPHCPRCKAFSGLRWKQEHKHSLMTCKACGQSYIPAETESVEKDDYDDALSKDNFTNEEVAAILKMQVAPPHPMERFRATAAQTAHAQRPTKPMGLLNRLWHRFLKI